MSKEGTRKLLEGQADLIERVLTQHKITGRVTGGIVTPRLIHFTISTNAKARAITALRDDLVKALAVESVTATDKGGSVNLEVRRRDIQPLNLLTLLSKLTGPMPPFTAALGMCDDGAPLLIRLPAGDVGQILVTGPENSGKLAICRSIILSLAMLNRPKDLRFILAGRDFADLATLPHLLEPVVTDTTQAVKTISGLDRMIGRDDLSPRVVIVIDDLADLSPMGSLAQLIKEGHKSGIHVIVSSRQAMTSAGFSSLLMGKGKPGEFEAAAAGQTIRFEAAYITPAKADQVLKGLMPAAPQSRLQKAVSLLAGTR